MHSKKLLGLFLALIFSVYSFAEPVELNPDHPQRHTVVKGDTLWDIAERFLRDPWLWPHIWKANPQIKNPHLIYPGDVISLTYNDKGEPVLTISRGKGRETVKLSPRIRERKLDRAIHTIPIDVIAPFMAGQLIVSEKELESAAYFVSAAGERLIIGANDNFYARSIKGGGKRFSIFRKGETFMNPAPGKEEDILGYEAIHVGSANLVREGDPATLRITKSNREAQIGDRILPTREEEYDSHFVPHAPDNQVTGYILNVLDGVDQIGRYSIVAISLGSREGMELGHVLAVEQAGLTIDDQVSEKRGDTVTLPDERAGIVMIFRVFDRVSYALVMKASNIIHVHDKVITP